MGAADFCNCKKVKIAFLNIYQEMVERGAETYVAELSKRLSKNHTVDIFSAKKLPPRRWPVLWRLFIDSNSLSICLFTLKNLGKIWREKYNVVVTVNGGWQAIILRIVTWLYGGRLVVSGQAGMGWDDRINLWVFPDTFVALSSFAEKWAKGVNPFVKVEYIPNGVDIKKFTKQGGTLKTNLKKPIILSVGALTKSKRLDLAIKAVSKFKNGSLLVVGDGELKDELKNLGKELLGDRFQLIKVPFSDMPKVYRAAEVSTLPSTPFHSFEIVIAEAMATNLPVVANEDPIRREIIGEAGYLVDPIDIEAYAQALEKSINTAWDDKPQNQAKKFDWDKITLSYEKLFKALMK